MNEILNLINSQFEIFKNVFGISNLVLILIIILIIISIIQSISLTKLKKTLKQASTVNLNNKIINEISRINSTLDNLNTFKTSTEINLKNILDNLKTIKYIKVIKYNPYADMGVGGNQSFSLSLIDKNGNGIILTSLYSREKSRALIKKINKFEPETELSPEEKEILTSLKNN